MVAMRVAHRPPCWDPIPPVPLTYRLLSYQGRPIPETPPPPPPEPPLPPEGPDETLSQSLPEAAHAYHIVHPEAACLTHLDHCRSASTVNRIDTF